MSDGGGNLAKARSHIIFILGLLAASAVVLAVEARPGSAPECPAETARPAAAQDLA